MKKIIILYGTKLEMHLEIFSCWFFKLSQSHFCDLEYNSIILRRQNVVKGGRKALLGITLIPSLKCNNKKNLRYIMQDLVLWEGGWFLCFWWTLNMCILAHSILNQACLFLRYFYDRPCSTLPRPTQGVKWALAQITLKIKNLFVMVRFDQNLRFQN